MDSYQYLKQQIISGHLRPNERLTEVKLAEQLNVSRTPIRQALQQLAFDGLVKPLTKGYVVSSFSTEDIIRIYKLRALLEGYAASEAAIHRTEEELKIMEDSNTIFSSIITQQQYIHNIQQLDEIIVQNRVFHETINSAGGNQILKMQIEKVILLPLVYRSFYWYDQYEMERSMHAHETIYRAIYNRQAERAKVAVEEHIFSALDHVLNHISKEAVLE